jgi:predicted dienelactone hydrolase
MLYLDLLLYIPLLISALIFLRRSFKYEGWRKHLPRLLLSAALAHAVLAGFRWQMAPVYFWILAIALIPMRFLTRRSAVAISYLILIGISISLSLLFPLFELPRPSGPHGIGTVHLQVAEDDREVYIQAWYPAAPSGRYERAPYWEEAWKASAATAKAQGIGWLPFVLSHLGLIDTHARLEAELNPLPEQFPVIVFSHGYGQPATFNTVMIEELASHGYVVLNLFHTNETPFVITPERKVIPADPIEMPRTGHAGSEPAGQRADSSGLDKEKEFFRPFYESQSFWVRRNDVWVEDIRLVIDVLETLSREWFSGRLDTNRVGVMGYSFGGGASGTAAIVDPRIRAGINMDGFQYGHLLDGDLRQPFLFMLSQGHRGENQFFFDRAQSSVYRMTLLGAAHSNFTDLSLLAELPARITGRLGPIDGARSLQIVGAYAVDFFNKHLEEEKSSFPSGRLLVYREAEFESRTPPMSP